MQTPNPQKRQRPYHPAGKTEFNIWVDSEVLQAFKKCVVKVCGSRSELSNEATKAFILYIQAKQARGKA